MDFNYTETQGMLRDTLARFLADTYDFDKRQKMIASDSGRDPGIWKALANDLGILSAPFSEAQGGLDGGAISPQNLCFDHPRSHRSAIPDEPGLRQVQQQPDPILKIARVAE